MDATAAERVSAVMPPSPPSRRGLPGAGRATIYARLSKATCDRLDALLRPAVGTGAGMDNAEIAAGEALTAEEPERGAGARSVLNFVRGDPGRASVNSVKRELERLAVIRGVALPVGLFEGVLPHEVELYRRRVAVQALFELRRLPEPTRLTWLAAFAHLRGRALTDSLVELLVETIHAIGVRAERRVEQQVVNELKKATGRSNLLFEIAGAALAQVRRHGLGFTDALGSPTAYETATS